MDEQQTELRDRVQRPLAYNFLRKMYVVWIEISLQVVDLERNKSVFAFFWRIFPASSDMRSSQLKKISPNDIKEKNKKYSIIAMD